MGNVLDKSGSLFDSNAYKKVWPEIDNIMPVKDPALIVELEKRLDADFASGKANNHIVMFIPSRRDETSQSVESYVFGKFTKLAPKNPLLNFNGWLLNLKAHGKNPSTEEAKRTRLHLLDEYKEEVRAYSVFDCFGYELSFNGQQYVLSSGIWYEVVASFLSKINSTASSINPPKVNLVHWQPPESEGEYNERCADAKKFLFFDAKNVMFGGGQSKFEFCDFLDPKTKTLFFAKITSRSSGMSHLVEQVRRTAELLFSTDDGYRSKLINVYGNLHPTADTTWLNSRPANGSWSLCLVSLGKNASQLPFFARCGLVRLYKELRERGHTVFFTPV